MAFLFGLFIINYVLFNLLKIRFSIRDKREEREIPGRKAAEKNKTFLISFINFKTFIITLNP